MTQDDSSKQGEPSSVWRYAKASRAHVVIDAEGYFDLLREAMGLARQRIFLIGWDFDTRIKLSGGRRWWHLAQRGRFPARLGAFILWLARRNPDLEIRVLKWNFAFFKSLFRGAMIFDMIRWMIHPRVHFRLDSAHPIGASHHEKIVIIDDKVVACGGIDMTSDRWDTRAHLPNDLRRTMRGGRIYAPWHDLTMLMEGDVAQALSDLGRERWKTALHQTVPACAAQAETPWPSRLKAEFRDVEVGIARTHAAYGRRPQVNEVEQLFLEHIARAKRFVYAETQYFASRTIAEAIARRLAEPDPPEFMLISTDKSDGWLEQVVMDTARDRLFHAVKEYDHADRFRIYIPYASDGTPIYVHAKLMIVDDEVLRIGSANMNNRSMGLDTECDVFLDAARPANNHIVPAIEALRHSLLAEHCGIEPSQLVACLEKAGSMFEAIDAIPKSGKHLAQFVPNPISDAEKALADSALLDPERPGVWFEPIDKRGLFRRGGWLHRPR